MPEAVDKRGMRTVLTIAVLSAVVAASLWAAQFSGAPQQYSATETILANLGADDGSAQANHDTRVKSTRKLVVDDQGELVIDEKTPGRLETALSKLGRLAEPEQLARLQDEVRAELPGKAGERAADLLRRYDRYRRALADEMARSLPRDADELYASLNVVIALRRQYFDAETADRMFGKEEAYSRYSIGVMRIEADQTLSAEERAAKIEALRLDLPPELAAGMMPPSRD